MIPKGQTLTIVDGQHILLPIQKLREKFNQNIRYLLEGAEIKVVTCDAEGFQQVWWINREDIKLLEEMGELWNGKKWIKSPLVPFGYYQLSLDHLPEPLAE